ncbi:wax ester/triacylglycerol synthase domain-containing protein [Streptomyces sp. NPDC057137]|uniref:wax ester/triacylglycerol synthase domain-containing protein n=1 Tax=Streptomyces sp. NPDC057137 TaxID=3346030 RepID=UPI003645AD9E
MEQRVLERVGGIPALNCAPPAPRDRAWTPAGTSPCRDTHLHHSLPTAPDTLADTCEALLARPLPPAPHPPWDLHLLTQPSTPDRFRVALRIHHGHQDGVGTAHTALALLSDIPGDGPPAHPAQRPRATRVLAALLRLAAPLLRAGPAQPALRTALRGTAGPHWDYRDIPLTRLRALADAHHCTVNDVCLAALALALRSLLPPAAPSPPSLLMALSTRQPHERHTPGNRVGAVRLVLPTTATTLPAALAAVHDQTAAIRRDRVRDANRLVLSLPRPIRPSSRLLRTLVGSRPYPLAVSSVSIPDSFTCFGARLDAASMFLTTNPHRPVYLSFTRTPDTVRCTVITDASRRNATALPRRWEQALTEGP